jgi:xylulokinase
VSVVFGVDSSTQSCKVVARDVETGAVVRQASVPHPPGTEVDPAAWEAALTAALDAAGGLADDVVALGIAAQQHGMVALDDAGEVVRPALLWNDTRSAAAAADLVAELGAETWATATGSVPVASLTVTKLRWLAEHEPGNASRVAAVCLPHDWLTARLLGGGDGRARPDALTTDRGDASGTGYWSPADDRYRLDLLERALGRTVQLPTVLAPWAVAGECRPGLAVSAGTGDNMGAALGLGAGPGDVVVSIGTSGVVSVVSDTPTSDATGTVAGFADATGRFLPLACTLNGAPVLAQVASLLGVDLERLSELALAAPPGAEGLVLVPYFEGERTPNLPDARGELVGLSLANTTPANLARAAVEGILCGLADGVDALVANGADVRRVVLVGGAARSPAVQQVAATVFDADVVVPEPGEYVALGAAWQAACAAAGGEPPGWPAPAGTAAPVPGDMVPAVRDRYREAAERAAAAATAGDRAGPTAVSGRP